MEYESKRFDAFKERMAKLNENDKKTAWERIFLVLQDVEQEANRKVMEELGLEVLSVPEVKPNVASESYPIIGSRTHRKKMQDLEISDVLKDTLNSVISLGGRASANSVSGLTHRQTNLESSYLKELWSKGLLLTRERDGRFVFYSTPEAALTNFLKNGAIDVDALRVKLAEHTYDHRRIEKSELLSIIDAAKNKNLVKLEGDVVSLA